MTKRVLAATAMVILALTASACSTGHTGPAPAHGRPVAAERAQMASLTLAAGRSRAHYAITAPSPAHYVFDVELTSPSAADVALTIRTWYGTTLSILSSSHAAGSCARHGSQDVCLEHFPLLPAQLAGTWTVVASKLSRQAARIHISVRFLKP
jgi:hypothetical protein